MGLPLPIVRVLLRAARWIITRYDPPNPDEPTTMPRFSVRTLYYEGSQGGDARKAWEYAKRQFAPKWGVLEFWDGVECRGRYPE